MAAGARPGAALLFAALVSLASPALGTPLLLAVPSRAASAPAPKASEVERATERAATNAQLARLEDLTAAGAPVPLLDRQLALTARLALLLAIEEQAPADSAGPAPPELPRALQGPPPYRVRDVDALRDLRDSVLAQKDSLAYSLGGLDAQVNDRLAARRRADEALRLKGDQLARARDGEARQRLQAETEVARLEARIAAVELARTDRERARARERLAALTAQGETLGDAVARVRRGQQLDDRELEDVVRAAPGARRALAQQRSVIERRLRALDATAAGRGAGTEAARREGLALRQRLALLSELDLLEAGREPAWRQRQRALQARTDDQREEAASVLRRSMEQLQARERATGDQLAQARSALRQQRLRVEGLPPQTPEAPGERQTQEALQSLVDSLEQAQTDLAGLARQLARTLDDVAAEAPSSDRLWPLRAWDELARIALAVWQYELFSVSDTTRADGRDVTVDYGVTVGKSAGALLLFGLGWAVATRLSRLGIGLLVRHAGLSPALGTVLRRWLLSILLLGVLVVVLKLARIPLTVFAFLGGALAIGVGFGTQNIIKNLISGVIILFERKVRVGDVVTVDGVSGTVTSVDLRATTVRGFDGIDAIVPNSQLLENRVGNWSLGTSIVRRAIVVGLRYGQDARLASAQLLACTRADPAVLAEPAPVVLFDDFGADAQVLRLQFWMRLGGARSGPMIESDLRHAISDAFAAHGLALASPQRDVRLEVAAPLQLRISSQAAN